jgi:hypothetical protein
MSSFAAESLPPEREDSVGSEFVSKNFREHALAIPERTAGMKVFDKANHVLVDSGLSCDTFNIVYITNGKKIIEAELAETLQHYKSKDLAFCVW